jgi:hypothetical protein
MSRITNRLKILRTVLEHTPREAVERALTVSRRSPLQTRSASIPTVKPG